MTQSTILGLNYYNGPVSTLAIMTFIVSKKIIKSATLVPIVCAIH
jgi:hypothetical protein